LFFHVGGGAVVVKPVRDWRPADIENDGKGTLIEYPLKTLLEQRWESARRGVSIVRIDSAPKARVEGSGSESDEPAVVVEVSFTSDAHVFTDDKE
jgi:hypothetical protein